jgi:hypothetical protein
LSLSFCCSSGPNRSRGSLSGFEAAYGRCVTRSRGRLLPAGPIGRMARTSYYSRALLALGLALLAADLIASRLLSPPARRRRTSAARGRCAGPRPWGSDKGAVNKQYTLKGSGEVLEVAYILRGLFFICIILLYCSQYAASAVLCMVIIKIHNTPTPNALQTLSKRSPVPSSFPLADCCLTLHESARVAPKSSVVNLDL